MGVSDPIGLLFGGMEKLGPGDNAHTLSVLRLLPTREFRLVVDAGCGKDGWRADKPHGGCVIDVPSGEFVSRGLSMPHSPRWHDGRLFVLESGTGGVVRVDPSTGRRDTVARLPGFTRGLAMSGPYAFVGLSKIRKTSAMDGVPLAQRPEQLKCGVAVVNWRSGQVMALLEFQTAVEEIFDVRLLPGLRFPEVIGFQHEAIRQTFVVPPVPPVA